MGRFLAWKNPAKAVHAAKRLKDEGFDFKLSMIGSGEEEGHILKLIDEMQLHDYVELLGVMPPEKVRTHMDKCDIFLFTSGMQEGWGAVLNEAMNSACAVVAGNAIGSVPFLLQDGVNGLVYNDGDDNDFLNKVRSLMHERTLREELGKNAYKTLADQWNASAASDNLLKLCNYLLSGKTGSNIKSGPCSIARPY